MSNEQQEELQEEMQDSTQEQQPWYKRIIPRWLSIPFVIVVAVIIYVFQADRSNFAQITSNNNEINILKQNVQACCDTTKKYQELYNQLHAGKEEVERIAREKYHMKRETEDLYLTEIQ